MLSGEILYCNVVNDADMEVTVQFLGDMQESSVYHLKPRESLPYILIEFTPTIIRYNGEHDFLLEVQSDRPS